MTQEQLIERADKAVEKKKTEASRTNPDGRISYRDLIIPLRFMQAKAETEPVTGVEKINVKEIFKEKKPGLFAVKVVHNFKKTKEAILIISSLYPTMSDDLQNRLNEYNEKLKEILISNFGTGDVKSLKKMRDHKNYPIYKEESDNLKKEYKPALDQHDTLEEEIRMIRDKPLIKPEFDYITDEDLQSIEISPEDIEVMWVWLERGR